MNDETTNSESPDVDEVASGPDLATNPATSFTTLTENPWFALAITGISALAIGFLAGRLFNTPAKPLKRNQSEQPPGYEE